MPGIRSRALRPAAAIPQVPGSFTAAEVCCSQNQRRFVIAEGEWSQMSGWGTGFPGVPASNRETDVAKDSGADAASANGDSAAE
jgi:hypothetical protein